GSPHVASVKYLGRQFLQNRVDVTGADCASSILLPSGESLWIFGDTVEGPFRSIRKLDLSRLRSSTAAIVAPQNSSAGIKQFQVLTDSSGKRARQVVPFLDGEDPAKIRLWPIHGIVAGRYIYLFYHRIILLDGVDVFTNFQLNGMGIAKTEIEKLQF